MQEEVGQLQTLTEQDRNLWGLIPWRIRSVLRNNSGGRANLCQREVSSKSAASHTLVLIDRRLDLKSLGFGGYNQHIEYIFRCSAI